MYLIVWVISVLVNLCFGHEISLSSDGINSDSCNVKMNSEGVTIKTGSLAEAYFRVNQSSNKLEFKTERSKIMLIGDNGIIRDVDSTLRNNDRILIGFELGEEGDELINLLPTVLRGHTGTLETINQRLEYLEALTVAILQFNLILTDDGKDEVGHKSLVGTLIVGHNLHRLHSTVSKDQVRFMTLQAAESTAWAGLDYNGLGGPVGHIKGGAMIAHMPGMVTLNMKDDVLYRYLLVIPLEDNVIDEHFLRIVEAGFGKVTASIFLHVISQLKGADDHAVILVP